MQEHLFETEMDPYQALKIVQQEIWEAQQEAASIISKLNDLGEKRIIIVDMIAGLENGTATS